MKISTKGEYGLRALFELAKHYGEEPLQSREIARRQNINEDYLNQLLIILRKAGIIRSLRGAQGGHQLARHPREVNLAEVVRVLEGSTSPIACLDEEHCGGAEMCVLRPVWQEVKTATDKILNGITLDTLINSDVEKQMYYI